MRACAYYRRVVFQGGIIRTLMSAPPAFVAPHQAGQRPRACDRYAPKQSIPRARKHVALLIVLTLPLRCLILQACQISDRRTSNASLPSRASSLL